MEIEFTNFTFTELNEAAKGYRNRALEFLSCAAKEINNYPKQCNKHNDIIYDVTFLETCAKNSINFVALNLYNASLQFSCFKKIELAKKERHKLCKKFTNKRYIKK